MPKQWPKPTSWGWGSPFTPTKADEKESHNHFPWPLVYVLWVVLPTFVVYNVCNHWLGWLILFPILAVVIGLPVFGLTVMLHSQLTWPSGASNSESYFIFKDEAFKAKWNGKKIPVEEFYEAYFAEKVDFEGDLLETLYNRREFIRPVITWNHIKFFLSQLIPELLVHSRQQDTEQVREHYDRGNDFYNSFLGPMMVYTSGIFNDPEETLEQAQLNKFELVANKIHLQKGDKHLDLGCGWGAFIRHCAKKYESESIGVTLAKEQITWHENLAKKEGVEKSAVALCMDYRDVPKKVSHKFDKITNLEMSEHVGIKRYHAYCRQVYDMLEDDGIYYLQIAGLRRCFQYEDLTWGLFMGKYVFPGADASCPLGWVINQLEKGGFEVHSVETIGIHYSATIKRWYDNWQKNKAYIVKKYGQRWFRVWNWFLAWAVLSPEHGMATCYQIVAHKNTSRFDRKIFIGERKKWKI